MGSSGNGMFGTYRGGGAGSIVNGGNNGEDECPLDLILWQQCIKLQGDTV